MAGRLLTPVIAKLRTGEWERVWAVPVACQKHVTLEPVTLGTSVYADLPTLTLSGVGLAHENFPAAERVGPKRTDQPTVVGRGP